MHASLGKSRLCASWLALISMGCAHSTAFLQPAVVASDTVLHPNEGLVALRITGRSIMLPASDAAHLPPRLRIAHSGTQLSTCTTGEHIDLWLVPTAPPADGSPTLTFAVQLDDEPQRPLVLEPLRGPWVRVAAHLPKGPHCITLTRNQEAQAGALDVGGVATSPGGTLWAPAHKPRQLWAIGDSITAGYGNLCATAQQKFSFFSEDIAQSYVARTAHTLDAEVTFVTSSGRGVWRNNDGSMEQTVPQLFARTLPDEPEHPFVLGKDAALPAAILVNLGTNDLRCVLSAADKVAFVSTYVAFLGRLRALAPHALIAIGLGPMLTDKSQPPNQLTLGRALVRQVLAQATRARLGPIDTLEFAMQTGEDGFGCQYHPNTTVHRQMSAQLTSFLSHHLGW